MQDYELKISQFVDNELPAGEQKELFLFLAENKDARKSLSDYMQMKVEARQYYDSINVTLDEPKVFTADNAEEVDERSRYIYMFYFSTAASIILAFLLLYTYFQPNPLLPKYYTLLNNHISLQEDHNIVLSEKAELYNITSELYEENEELKSRQASLSKKNNTPPVIKVVTADETQKRPAPKNNYLTSIPVVNITEDDFLGPKIIGN